MLQTLRLLLSPLLLLLLLPAYIAVHPMLDAMPGGGIAASTAILAQKHRVRTADEEQPTVLLLLLVLQNCTIVIVHTWIFQFSCWSCGNIDLQCCCCCCCCGSSCCAIGAAGPTTGKHTKFTSIAAAAVAGVAAVAV